MPVCVNCGTRLTPLDKQACPVCGHKSPLLDATTSDTSDLTQVLTSTKQNYKLLSAPRKYIVFLLLALVGFTGASFFYLHRKFLGILDIIASLASMTGLYFLFALTLKNEPLSLHIMLPIAIIYLVHVVLGLYIILMPNVKDGHGEFIR